MCPTIIWVTEMSGGKSGHISRSTKKNWRITDPGMWFLVIFWWFSMAMLVEGRVSDFRFWAPGISQKNGWFLATSWLKISNTGGSQGWGLDQFFCLLGHSGLTNGRQSHNMENHGKPWDKWSKWSGSRSFLTGCWLVSAKLGSASMDLFNWFGWQEAMVFSVDLLPNQFNHWIRDKGWKKIRTNLVQIWILNEDATRRLTGWLPAGRNAVGVPCFTFA